MSEGLLNGLYIIPILAVLILIHEIGHFASARAVGVTVEEFGIGIPPRAASWRYKDVLWSINWIPFGGFVRVLGEDGKNADPGSMNTKSPLQRAFFLVAGSAMNVLLALVLMILVVGIQGLPTFNSYIDTVLPGSPAASAGWLRGDRIVEVDGRAIDDRDELGQVVRDAAGNRTTVVIERRGKQIPTVVIPRENPPADEGPTGVGLSSPPQSEVTVTAVVAGGPAAAAGLIVGDRLVSINDRPADDRFVIGTELERFAGFAVPVVVDRGGESVPLDVEVPILGPNQDPLRELGFSARAEPIFEHVSALQVIPRGLQEAWEQTQAMVRGIRDLFTGAAPLGQVAGPIGMGQITSEIVSDSVLPLWVTLAQLSILLSLNLAILNLLPLPALDGGRLVFVLIELLRGGRRIAPEREGLVHFAGLVLLLGFMFVIAFFDVGRLLSGDSFLP